MRCCPQKSPCRGPPPGNTAAGSPGVKAFAFLICGKAAVLATVEEKVPDTYLSRGLANFSVKSQVIHISDFADRGKVEDMIWVLM